MSNLPTTEALKEAEHLRRSLLGEFSAITALRSRVENEARNLISEMAVVGSRIARAREILPDSNYKYFYSNIEKHGNATACLKMFDLMSSEAKSEAELFSSLNLFRARETHNEKTTT